MNRKTFRSKLCLVVWFCLMFALSYSNAFAWDRGRSHHEVVTVGRERYNYREGRFYIPGWFGFEIVATPPIGAIVTFIPVSHRTILVGGLTYYYYDNIYYRPCPSGYIVVPAPVVTPTVVNVPSTGETVTINVPNANGSYTPITLVKHNNGYVGPQGEYYPGNPTVEQLRVLYGK